MNLDLSLKAIYRHLGICEEVLVPMNDVCQEVVVFEPVVGIYPFVVDCEGASSDAPLVLSCGVGPELPRKHIENLLADPPPFCEGRECEVVRVNFPEACKKLVS